MSVSTDPKKFGGYLKKEILGSGTYGVVWFAIHQGTGRNVAIKSIKTDYNSPGIPATS